MLYALAVVAFALVVAEVVVSSWWLHLVLVLAIALALYPIGREFARRNA